MYQKMEIEEYLKEEEVCTECGHSMLEHSIEEDGRFTKVCCICDHRVKVKVNTHQVFVGIEDLRMRQESEIRKRIEYLEKQLNDRAAKDIALGSLRALRWVINDQSPRNWK